MEEIYKDIPNYEGHYQVSNLGNVKSVKLKKEKILKCSYTKTGYGFVNLCLNNKVTLRQVHQLMAMAFLNHKPCGHNLVVDHIDNNPSNNKLENLQIITHRKNTSKDKKGYSSKYIGVSWHKPTKKWVVMIRIKDKHKNLGYFEDEYEAHLAYQKELKQII